MRFYERRPRKPKAWSDPRRLEHAIMLQAGVPVRIHGTNGGYLFSLFADDSGRVWRYKDKTWGDARKINAVQVTWEKPI